MLREKFEMCVSSCNTTQQNRNEYKWVTKVMIDDPFSDLLKTNKRKENISKLNDDLAYEILSVVEEIPAGRVATYGQIAKLIGREKNSRLVARVLSHVGNYGEFPCYRVVNHMGRLAPGWAEQEWLLKGEGVTLKENGCVDLKKYLWEC